MGQLLVEYFLNSIWQVLLLAAGAWLLLRALRPGPLVQHWIWLGLLPLALALPLLSLHATHAAQPLAPRSATIVRPAPVVPPLPPPQSGRVARLPNPPPIKPAASSPTAPTPAAPTHIRKLNLGPTLTRVVVGFYLATILFAVIRLFLAWQAARRMLAASLPAQLNPADSQLLDACCRRLGVRAPSIRESAAASSPTLIGIVHPSLLLPLGLTNQPQSCADLEAIFLHELAHLRRRDCLANFLCRVVTLPIAYHPATWAIRQRIRQSQEMLCDAIAVAQLQSPAGYARCLVALAQKMQPGTSFAQVYGTNMFDGRILEERVMRIIETKTEVPTRTRILRLACGVVVMSAALTAASLIHLTPTFAQSTNPPAIRAIVPEPSADPLLTQASQPSQPAHSSQPSQAKPRTAAQPTPASHSAESAPPTPTPADMEALQVQMDYAQKVLDGLVQRQAIGNNAMVGDHIDTSSADFKKQLDDARKQYDDVSRKMQEADEAHEKHDAYLERLARDKQQQALMEAESQARKQQQDPQTQQQQIQQLQQQYQQLMQQEALKMAEIQSKLIDPAFKTQMDGLDSGKIKQQLDAAEARLSQPDLAATFQKLSSPEFQKAIADAAAKANSPELMVQMAKLTQLEQQLAALCYQLQDEQDRIRAALQKAQAAQPTSATATTKEHQN